MGDLAQRDGRVRIRIMSVNAAWFVVTAPDKPYFIVFGSVLSHSEYGDDALKFCKLFVAHTSLGASPKDLIRDGPQSRLPEREPYYTEYS